MKPDDRRRRSRLRNRLLAVAVGWQALVGTPPAQAVQTLEWDVAGGTVLLSGVRLREPDGRSCIAQVLDPLLEQIRDGRMVSQKVRVSRQHPLVRQAMQPPSLRYRPAGTGEEADYWMSLASGASDMVIRAARADGAFAAMRFDGPGVAALRPCLDALSR